MIQYRCVEDYIEVICGVRNIDGSRSLMRHSLWQAIKYKPTLIKLAHYDVPSLAAMLAAISKRQAMTSKQAELACKIILKYSRQLQNHGIDVSPVVTPTWRFSVRDKDYSHQLSLRDELIIIKFPYNLPLISDLRRFRTYSQGDCRWNSDLRVWQCEISEYNLLWLMQWAVNAASAGYEFDIDPALILLHQQVSEVIDQDYRIELVKCDEGFAITNCPKSLEQYIDEHVGGFATDNLLRLVDYSGILGYTISPEITQVVQATYGKEFLELATNQTIKLSANAKEQYRELDKLLDYIDLTQRWPALFYDLPGSNFLADYLAQRRMAEHLHIQDDWRYPLWPQTRYICFSKSTQNLQERKFPILVSGCSIMDGSKQQYLEKAERVVFAVNAIYNSFNKTGQKN